MRVWLNVRFAGHKQPSPRNHSLTLLGPLGHLLVGLERRSELPTALGNLLLHPHGWVAQGLCRSQRISAQCSSDTPRGYARAPASESRFVCVPKPLGAGAIALKSTQERGARVSGADDPMGIERKLARARSATPAEHARGARCSDPPRRRPKTS